MMTSLQFENFRGFTDLTISPISATPDYNFALHRLQRAKGGIEAITHDREMLEVAIKSGLEVR